MFKVVQISKSGVLEINNLGGHDAAAAVSASKLNRDLIVLHVLRTDDDGELRLVQTHYGQVVNKLLYEDTENG